MTEERVYLTEVIPIIKHYTKVPIGGLAIGKRAVPHVTRVPVLITNRQIIVDKKLTVTANIAAVSVGDDEDAIERHNQRERAMPGTILTLGSVLLAFGVVMLIFFPGDDEQQMGRTLAVVGALIAAFGWLKRPFLLPPDYSVVIESAGTQDKAIVVADRQTAERVVAAIRSAIVGA